MKQQGVVTCRADDLVKQCLLNMQRVLQSHGVEGAAGEESLPSTI